MINKLLSFISEFYKLMAWRNDFHVICISYVYTVLFHLYVYKLQQFIIIKKVSDMYYFLIINCIWTNATSSVNKNIKKRYLEL